MNRRPYRSKARTDAAEETRKRIVTAAAELLGATPYAPFSLEAVAKKAGVTRLTVYNQFGGRGPLLEAVFDQSALAAGLDRLAEAAATPDPRRALALMVERFCAFWHAGLQAHLRLHAARAADPELDQALQERNERRRRLLRVIVNRLAERKEIAASSMPDLVDVLHVLTGIHVFAGLVEGRGVDAARELIQGIADDALSRAAASVSLKP